MSALNKKVINDSLRIIVVIILGLVIYKFGILVGYYLQYI